MSIRGAEPKDTNPVQKDNTNRVVQVVQALKKIDDKAPNAQLNKTTITDGNGGRIKLNEEEKRRKPSNGGGTIFKPQKF